MKRFAWLTLLPLTFAGCTAVSSVWNGITAVPQTTADLAGFYHFGQILIPIIGHVWQILSPLLWAALGGL